MRVLYFYFLNPAILSMCASDKPHSQEQPTETSPVSSSASFPVWVDGQRQCPGRPQESHTEDGRATVSLGSWVSPWREPCAHSFTLSVLSYEQERNIYCIWVKINTWSIFFSSESAQPIHLIYSRNHTYEVAINPCNLLKPLLAPFHACGQRGSPSTLLLTYSKYSNYQAGYF